MTSGARRTSVPGVAGGIEYARVGDAQVAYQVHGAGDLDIVYSPGLASHLDLTLEQPRYRRYVEALGRLGRVIRFDRRGVGVSDPLPPGHDETWEQWAEDLAAVLDHAGSEQAVVIATNDAGPVAMLFAAVQPGRTRALVLFNTTARFGQAPDHPDGHPPEVAEAIVQLLRTTWGREEAADLLAPSLAADAPFRTWYSRFQRGACRPAEMADTLARMFRMDARRVLPEIRCPTLVLHRKDYALLTPRHGQYLASHIPGAVYEELGGGDAPIYTQDMQDIVDRIGDFLGRAPEPQADGRTFTTVLFSDIVGSTERAVALGDARWHALLDAHDAVAREVVAQDSGRIIKSTGDGILATFDAASRALHCAGRLRARLAELGIEVRVGVHSGPVVQRLDGDISGVAVHIAARVMGEAGTGEVLVTGGVLDLVTADAVTFEDRGERDLKGIPQRHRLFAAVAA